jgi:hypothetical protein
MFKVGLSDGIGIVGIVLAIVLVVLDKAEKLKGPWLFVLLAVAAVMTLFIALGNAWVLEAPEKWRLWRGALLFLLVVFVYSGVSIWIGGSKASPRGAPEGKDTHSSVQATSEMKGELATTNKQSGTKPPKQEAKNKHLRTTDIQLLYGTKLLNGTIISVAAPNTSSFKLSDLHATNAGPASIDRPHVRLYFSKRVTALNGNIWRRTDSDETGFPSAFYLEINNRIDSGERFNLEPDLFGNVLDSWTSGER